MFTREGALVTIPNDGSGVFSSLTQRRDLAAPVGSVGSHVGDSAVVPLAPFDPTKTPRMIALSNGDVAIALEKGVSKWDYDATTGTYTSNRIYHDANEVFDMKTVSLSGQPGAVLDLSLIHI